MFAAQILMGGSTIYGPWMERDGDNVSITLDVIEISSATIEVKLFTKNSEDPGDGIDANVSEAMEATTVGRLSNEYLGDLKELVRYKYTVTGQSTTWVLFRMLDAVWFNSVKA